MVRPGSDLACPSGSARVSDGACSLLYNRPVFQIGSSLREARLRSGYDLAEAEAATKIRTTYLKALEEERFDSLPAQTYVKGFLRSYAEFLGLDGQIYVDEYNSRYGGGSDDDEYVPRTRRQRPSRTYRRFESRILVLALVGIAAATALVVIASAMGVTILTPATAAARLSGRRRSAWRGRTPDRPSESSARRWGSRPRATTDRPLASRASTRAEPIPPVAPLTRTVPPALVYRCRLKM